MTSKEKTPFKRYVGSHGNTTVNVFLPTEVLFNQLLQDSLLRESLSKDPKKIIAHCRKQIRDDTSSEKLPDEWARLEQVVQLAETALNENRIDEACFYFYWLGQKAEFLTHWESDAEFKDYIHTQVSKHHREKGFRTISNNQKWLRELAQDLAKKIWKHDTENQLRTNTVAERVWSILVDSQKSLEKAGVWELVGEHRTIRGWVSAVAPVYARKPGRPKKHN